MTEEQADIFINEVLKGFWPRWDPQDYELTAWQTKLIKFEFDKAKKVLNDIFFSANRTIDPPAGKIIKLLKAEAIELGTAKNDPLLLFEIIKDGNIRGQRFYSTDGSEPKSKTALENYAEKLRNNFNSMYKANHIIKWHYDAVPF